MIALGILTKPAANTEQTPAKAWRNKWRCILPDDCQWCGTWVQAREVYWECNCIGSFPTKAEAEADAINDIMLQIQHRGRLRHEWLGSFPEPT